MKLVYGINNVIRKNNKDGQYYYFGFNFENKQRLLDIGIDLFDTRELISKSAHEIKFDFINYITEIGKKQKNELMVIPSKRVISKIFLIRSKKVMLDKDLADLYGVETKSLNRQVKRNLKRFPGDFMFELSKEEHENLRYQIGTSSSEYGGRR